MARANLEKSKYFSTSTTTASKYIPKSELMQILGLLGMYFDAVVVEVEKYLLFFRLAVAILWVIDKPVVSIFEKSEKLQLS